MDSTPASPLIRFARPADADALFGLIEALAEYEKLSHEVTGDAATLAKHLGAEGIENSGAGRPVVEAILAEVDGQTVGFALFFTNYSTFLTKPGVYLEDLFVLPAYRGIGLGKLLLAQLARLALERDCGRLEWSVLDWNEPAIAFYQHMGATVLTEWRICRVDGDAIAHLAAQSKA